MQFLPNAVINPAAPSLLFGPTISFPRVLPRVLTLQATFVFGSGSSVNCDVFVQTNIDGGAIHWCDVAHFAFTTASATFVAKVVADTAFVQGAPTDGTLAVGTTNSIIGPLWRVRYLCTGAYTASIQVDAAAIF